MKTFTNKILPIFLLLFFEVHCYYYTMWGGISPADYSGMSDIDWSKRSYHGNWLNPAYKYVSMADIDWGWRKRDDEGLLSEKRKEVADDMKKDMIEDQKRAFNQNDDWSNWNGYNYYRPIALASRRYQPLSRSIPIQNRAYNFHSMADMDWGWKKRKRSGFFSKKNLASLAGWRPSRIRNNRKIGQ